MHAYLADETKRQLGVEPPVEFLLPCGVGRDAPPACFLVPLPLGQGVFTHRSGTNKVDQEMPLRVRTRLQADLKIKLGCSLGSLGDCPGIFDFVSHRRFAVHVFPGLDRGQNDFPVMMCRRGNNHGPDVFIRE